MLKFEYHLDKKLYLQEPPNPPQEISQSFTTDWGGAGFVLEPINHWITFTVWPNKIRVFYKEVKPNPEDIWDKELQSNGSSFDNERQIITYYQKDLPKQETISFTFLKEDQVHKVNRIWVKKH